MRVSRIGPQLGEDGRADERYVHVIHSVNQSCEI